MKDIITDLIEYNEKQKQLLNTLESNNLDKRLNIKKLDNKFYYSILDKSISNNYISTDDIDLIKEIGKNNYEIKLHKILLKRIEIVNKFIKKLKRLDLSEVYNNLHPGRKAIVNPIEASYEVMLDKWINQKYIFLDFPIKPDLESKNGEFMRSKSELILADLFHDYNLKYKYEKKLVLRNNITYYPDFTFLGKDLTEIYWEHFGKMNDLEYINQFIYKIKNYEKNNIKLWDNLIVTFESEEIPFNRNYARYLIEKYLL